MAGPAISRFVSDTPGADDDSALPYQVDALDCRGRVVRLGAAVDAILSRHGYPAPVSRLLGEALVLTAMLGSALKSEGRFQLQTRSDGPVSALVVDFDTPGNLRAHARFDAARLSGTAPRTSAELLGRGHLAFTMDMGAQVQRYQGVVPLDGQGLEEAAHSYFERSEQIATVVKLVVAEEIGSGGSRWRAGGIMAQFLPQSENRRRAADLAPGDRPAGVETAPAPAEDDAWVETKALIATVEDHELVDPAVSAERLLYRLFNEHGVRVFDRQPLADRCRCSSDRILDMLKGFSADDRQAMVGPDGQIGVTCEFCSVHYSFEPAEVEAAVRAIPD